MHKHSSAIMCTGGIDSTTLLYLEQAKGNNPIPITVDYGHVAFQKQVELLQYHIENLGLPPLQIIKIEFPEWQRKPGLFTADFVPDENAPLESWDALRYENFFIEGRNTIMLAYALAYCSAHKIDELLTGYLYGEEEWKNRRSIKLMTGDNSPQFVDAMNIISQLGYSYQVRIRAPFYEERFDKRAVVEIGKTFGVDFSKTYSCYFIPECGKCDNCLLRKSLNL